MHLRLQIENFRLFAALRLQPQKRQDPVALVDESGRVAELNQAAQAHNLAPGMTMARVLARTTGITVLHADPAAERSAQRILWKTAWQVTPQIELGEGPLTGSATLKLIRPNLEKLSQQVPKLLERLRQTGLPARAGLAATPKWAGFAALAAERFQLKILHSRERAVELMAHLPLATLHELTPHACDVLERWGIRSLKDLAKLPRQALGERLGPEGLQAWDIVNGSLQQPLHIRELEPDYCERFDLEEPISDLPSLLTLIHQATASLQLQMEQSGKLARTLSLNLWMENGHAAHKRIHLPEATRRADLMERIITNYLKQLTLHSPVTGGQLTLDPVAPLSRQAGLFERSVRNPWRLQETLDQLAGLLGSESFGSPRLLDSHRPDAYRLITLPNDPKSADLHSPSKPAGPPTMGPPLHRFRPPLPATLQIENGRLAYLKSSIAEGFIRATHGPYPMSGDWAGAEPWSLSEWDIEIESAGVFCLRRINQNWQLIGAYD